MIGRKSTAIFSRPPGSETIAPSWFSTRLVERGVVRVTDPPFVQ